MSEEEKTAQEFLAADAAGYCMGDGEAARLLKMLAFIEIESPGPRRKAMLDILAEEMAASSMCRFHWKPVEQKLAEVVKVPNVLQ